jgi:dihydroorotate dehydrogenase (NAD+) catalytic subunit
LRKRYFLLLSLLFFLSGAAAIQVGSATFPHPGTMIEIIEGIEEFMKKRGIKKLGALNIRD